MIQFKKNKVLRDAIQVPFVEDGMAIGLFGGSFNPPHKGHVHVAETALKRLQLDRIWWMVSPGNPLKDQKSLAPLAERLAHSNRLAKNPRIDVSALEAGLNSRYSADLVHHLTRRYPTVRFVWIMGADNLTHFHQWDRWQEIVLNLPMAVIDRPGDTLSTRSSRMARKFSASRIDETDAPTLKQRKAPAWVFLHAPRSHLSSTKLRAGT